jgi:hypothetical protein
MFGIKKLRHDLYWLRKEFDNLKDDVIKMKAAEYFRNTPPEFKAGDKAIYKYESDCVKLKEDVLIIREGEPRGFTRVYWIDNGSTVMEAVEYRLFKAK